MKTAIMMKKMVKPMKVLLVTIQPMKTVLDTPQHLIPTIPQRITNKRRWITQLYMRHQE